VLIMQRCLVHSSSLYRSFLEAQQVIHDVLLHPDAVRWAAGASWDEYAHVMD
jgi:hypothetical protein